MKSINAVQFLADLGKSEFGQKYLEIVNRGWKLPENYNRYLKLKDKKDGYEVHHIQPLSLGGEQRGNNRVYLSTLDHVLAHYYLALACPCVETTYAFWCITGVQTKTLQESEVQMVQKLEHYSELRDRAKQLRSKAQLGRVHTPEHRKKVWETRRKNGTDHGWKYPEDSMQKSIETRRKNGTLGKNNMTLAWKNRRKNGTDHVSEEAKQKRLETLKTSEAWKNCHGPEVVAKIQATKKRNGTLAHTSESKQKISKALKGRHRVYDSEGHWKMVKD